MTSIANSNHDMQQQSLPSLPLPVEVIYRFPRRTSVENLTIRSNGLILATTFFAPEIYQVDPKTCTVSLVAEIPAATGLLGIAEIEKDVFYVVAGNISATLLIPTAGNFSVWRVDINMFKPNKSLAKVQRVVEIPQAKFLNGATVLSRKEWILLIADSLLGSVFRVNTRSKEAKVVMKDPLFDVASATSVAVGINGLKLDRNNDEPYFTNTNQDLFGKSPSGLTEHPRLKGKFFRLGLCLRMILRSGARCGFSSRRMGLISCLLFLLPEVRRRCW